MLSLIPWSLVKADFKPDGALRDIYVFNTTPSDWERLWEHLLLTSPAPVCTIDGEPVSPTFRVANLLAHRAVGSPRMNIDRDGIDLACHFFSETEIEFDLVPEQVANEESWVVLQGFMAEVGDLLSKPVHLTEENTPHLVIASYTPASRAFTFVPPQHGRGAT